MATFLILVLVIGGLITLIVWAAQVASRETSERQRVQVAEQQAESQRQEVQRQTFLANLAEGWAFHCGVRVGPDEGLIALNADGTTFRIATIIEHAGELAVASDSLISVVAIRSITVDQRLKPQTRTQVERVPVVVQDKRSTVGRAVIGTMIAGPLGGVVGAISAGHGGTAIEHHEMRRSETTYVKGEPVLVIATGSLAVPTIKLRFADAKALNSWSARLWAARGW